MKPLFGGFFAYGGVLRRWGNPRVTFIKSLFGGFFAMVMYCAVWAILSSAVFPDGDDASRCAVGAIR